MRDLELKLLEMLQRAAPYLEGKGIENARLDAEVLLADLLGVTRMDLYVQFERPVTTGEQDAYRERIRRRSKHEPVAYIVGYKEFWSRRFAVGPGVLIPRPDTETLVEAVLAWADSGRSIKILDVGTGSGAIAAALASELPLAEVFATDVSASAVACAEGNLERLGLDERVRVALGSGVEPFKAHAPFDVIVSNPPYIAESERGLLAQDVVSFEPPEALFGGVDGLDVIRAVVSSAAGALAPGGLLALEVGFAQKGAVTKILESTSAFVDIESRKDLAGVDRCVLARRAEGSL